MTKLTEAEVRDLWDDMLKNKDLNIGRIVPVISQHPKKEGLVEYRYHDLGLTETYRIIFNDHEFVINQGMAKELINGWRLDPYSFQYPGSIFHSIALTNLEKQEPVIKTIKEVLESKLGLDIFSEAIMPIVPYILSNENNHYGASQMLLKRSLMKVSKLIGNGGWYYILPSSIHEVICVPTNVGDEMDFIQMVRQVNEEQVLPEERLSDDIFRFDGHSLLRVERR